MSILTVLIAVGTALAAVAVGIAARRMSGAWLRFHSQFVVICPENRQPAGVVVNFWRAARTAWRGGPRLQVTGCSRWPERGGCDQLCLNQIGTAPQNCRVRNILAAWYEGKNCVRCGHPVGEAYWGSSKPALLVSGVLEQCDQIPGPELLIMLETAQPVCFDCYVDDRVNRNTAALAAH